MEGFSKGVPLGTICIIVVCTLSVIVNSQNIKRNTIEKISPSSQNGTIINDINATGEIMKRVGEFASRALWVRKGKFILPTGTILTLAPKITIPAFRRKAFKGGLNSDFQATLFFYINCDKLGFTHEMHPFPFDRPPFYPFGSLMRPIEGKDGGDKKGDKEKKPVGGPQPDKHQVDPSYSYEPLARPFESYKNGQSDLVYSFFPIHKRTGESESQAKQQKPGVNSRKPRSVMSLPPPDKLLGGERALLLPSIENMMSNFGFPGRGCMLRAICEIHEFPLQEGYGLLGEMIALFFSVSQSPYAESHMPEYLKAEDAGRRGDCSSYRNVCHKSIFKWGVEKKQDENDAEINEIPSSPYRSKFEDDEL